MNRLLQLHKALKDHALPPLTQTKFNLSLSDKQAEAIGQEIAKDFDLKRAKEYDRGYYYPNRWQTRNGTFTNKGIARRALRLILKGA